MRCLWMSCVAAFCLLFASPATAVQLLSDAREVRVFALVCDLDCVQVGGLETPSAPFAIFDADVPGAQFHGSQHSEVSGDLILGQGAASGSIDGYARSILDITFEVLQPTSIVFEGTLTAMGPELDGEGVGQARLDLVGGGNVFLEGACGSCTTEDVVPVLIETMLDPGTYALLVQAGVAEFGQAGSYDFSLSFVPEPTSAALFAFGVVLALSLGERLRR